MDEALALDPLRKIIRVQLGVYDIMNRCPKIEYGRLSGEIGWQGVNSRRISSKRPRLAGKGRQRLTIEYH